MNRAQRAQVVLFDGFDLLDVVAPFEVLHAGGELAGGGLTVELVSAEGPREVPSGAGVPLRATAALDPTADIIVIPGASGPVDDSDREDVDTVPQLLARTLETRLPALAAAALDRSDTTDATVATVCGGALVLAMAGLLEGRHAVTHHMGLDLLDAAGAQVVRARVVDDGNLVSAGGVTSGLDLGLFLLERHLGPQIALAVEEMFEYERRGTVWRAVGATPAPARSSTTDTSSASDAAAAPTAERSCETDAERALAATAT